MVPQINPKQLEAAMKKLGVKQEIIDASEVIIKTKLGKNLIVKNPQVTKVNMMGQESLQIIGDIVEENGITQEDIYTVAEQADVEPEIAKKALERNKGDLAAAILALKKK